MSVSTTIVAVLSAALLISSAGVSEGQTSSSCVSNLLPCVVYLNSTTPSSECCNSIKQVLDTQLQCLCNLFRNPPLVPGLNFTQALLLPSHCNISGDASICNASTPPPRSSAVPNPPPAPPGQGENAASKVTRMGLPPLVMVTVTVTVLTFLY